MLIIEWLDRLPNADGVIISRKTVTHCDSAAEAAAQADELWSLVQTAGTHCPDGFQVVDEDRRVIQLARFAVAWKTSPDNLPSTEL